MIEENRDNSSQDLNNVLGNRSRSNARAGSVCCYSNRKENITPISEGKAIVYCEIEFLMANGKTAHSLVRHTDRYKNVGPVKFYFSSRGCGRNIGWKKQGVFHARLESDI